MDAVTAYLIAGAVVMAWTGWYRADALISAGIGLVVLWGTGGILREAFRRIPRRNASGARRRQGSGTIRAVDGVDRVHREFAFIKDYEKNFVTAPGGIRPHE